MKYSKEYSPHILIIASAREREVTRAVSACEEKHCNKKASITILGFNDLDYNGHNVIRYKTTGKHFNLFLDLLPILRLTNKLRLDETLLLYNNIYGCSYSHLEILSSLIKTKKRLTFNVNGKILPLSIFASFSKVVGCAFLSLLISPVLLPLITAKNCKKRNG